MIAGPDTRLTGEEIPTPCDAGQPANTRRREARQIAGFKAILAVRKIALARGVIRPANFDVAQSRTVARTDAGFAVGEVTLVIGQGQSHNLLAAKCRAIAGIKAVSAIRDIAQVISSRHIDRLLLRQSGTITGLPARPAVRQILSETGYLSQSRAGKKRECDDRHPESFPVNDLHAYPPFLLANQLGHLPIAVPSGS